MLALAALQPVGLIPLNGLHQPDIEWRALVQTRLHRAMMRNAIVRPDRRSVQRTALRPTDHHLVRELVHELQTELAGSGDHDGGSGDLRDPYNDLAVGAALPSRIRKALVALRSARGRIVEDGRDLYKGSRTMGVPVPGDKAGQTVDFF